MDISGGWRRSARTVEVNAMTLKSCKEDWEASIFCCTAVGLYIGFMVIGGLVLPTVPFLVWILFGAVTVQGGCMLGFIAYQAVDSAFKRKAGGKPDA